MAFYMSHRQTEPNRTPRKLCQSDTACCAVCQPVVDLQDQLAKARAVVQDLQERMGALELRTDLNRSHPSIIDRLPQEIASEIFVYHAAEASQARDVLCLGAVCQNWRRIAWSSQRVWRSLIIKSRQDRVVTAHIPLVKEWLDRSGRLPLSIIWTQPSLRIFDDEYDRFPLVDVMNSQADRWESLNLHLPSPVLELFDASTASDPTSLKALMMKASDDNALRITKLDFPTPRVIEVSANLRPEATTLNWNMASHVTVTLPTAEDVLRLFEQGPHLLTCKVQLNYPFWKSPSTASYQITHSLLNDLDIQFEKQDSIEAFVNSLTFPALEHLHLRASDKILPVPIFVSFLTRSTAVLKSLTFHGVGLTQEGLIPIARLIPSLERLTIKLPYGKADNFRPLYFALTSCISPTNPDTLLPSLREFCWSGEADFPWKVLPYFLRPLSRNDPTSCRPLTLIKVYSILNCRHHDFPKISKEMFALLRSFTDRVKFQLNTQYDGDYYDLFEVWQFL